MTDTSFVEKGWVVCDEDHFRIRFPIKPERKIERINQLGQESGVTTLRAAMSDGTVLVAGEQALKNSADLGVEGFIAATKAGLATKYTILSEQVIATPFGAGVDLELSGEGSLRVQVAADASNRRIYTLVVSRGAAPELTTINAFFSGFEPR